MLQKNYKYKCLRPSDFKRDELLKAKCDKLMERINNFQFDCLSEKDETSDIIETSVETPQKTNPSKEQVCILFIISNRNH